MKVSKTCTKKKTKVKGNLTPHKDGNAVEISRDKKKENLEKFKMKVKP